MRSRDHKLAERRKRAAEKQQLLTAKRFAFSNSPQFAVSTIRSSESDSDSPDQVLPIVFPRLVPKMILPCHQDQVLRMDVIELQKAKPYQITHI